MNERYEKLFAQAHIEFAPGGKAVIERFAELIIRECMRMCDVAAVGYETHGHNDIARGCDSAKEYIADWFEVEE